jgi:hypothetical protein
MFILLTFVGTLPSYIVECIFQIRIFCQNDIYLITNDLNSPFVNDISKFDVKMILYDDIVDDETIQLFQNNKYKFNYVNGLIGREELFMRSQERFFLAHNFLKKFNLTDCFFMEIDNLIYDDPNKWLKHLQKNNFAIMNHTMSQCSSGICYIKDKNTLDNYIAYAKEYIRNSQIDYGGIFSEMHCLFQYKNMNLGDIQMLPIIYSNYIQNDILKETYQNYNDYQSIFDGAALGVYLLGQDSFHNNGKIIKNKTCADYLIQANQYMYKWVYENGYKKPYIYDQVNDTWILINNLHVHAKNLNEGLSKPLSEFT